MKNIDILSGPFKGDWQSLYNYECPEWFRNAKFGIWSHWGPQSVPMIGDWYARSMYVEGTPQYRYHCRKYGHPSQVGWKDVVNLWHAENFEPEALMQRYVDAGAKYFCAQAVHHDNFDNWDSKFHKWNAVNMGPKKNIVGLWQAAAKNAGLPFGLTEHLAASFSWWHFNKGSDKYGPFAGVPYDGNNPEFADLYHPNNNYINQLSAEQHHHDWPWPWYTSNQQFHQHWFNRIKDLIDQHQPDLLYSDGTLPFQDYGLSIVAHLYNTSIQKNGENLAVYTQKETVPQIYKIGVLDIERGGKNNIFPDPWQTDTCIGGWFYDAKAVYKTPKKVISMLVDIVSKNGCLLLNILQKPDGTIDDECSLILDELKDWFSINAEAIHDSRPWYVAQEGQCEKVEHHFHEPETVWQANDFRFTSKPNTIYVFQLEWPQDGQTVIKSFGMADKHQPDGSLLTMVNAKNVSLLGSDKKLTFGYQGSDFVISGLPEKPPARHVVCYKIEI